MTEAKPTELSKATLSKLQATSAEIRERKTKSLSGYEVTSGHFSLPEFILPLTLNPVQLIHVQARAHTVAHSLEAPK